MEYTAHKTDYVLRLIESDPWVMDVLRTVMDLKLPDWWVAAGFVRNKVWDDLHKYSRRTAWQDTDVDVVYYNSKNTEDSIDKNFELQLFTIRPGVPWSVKNQARSHLGRGAKSAAESIAKWPETATCVGVRLDNKNKIELLAPYGAGDIVDMVLRPNSHCEGNPQDFERRLITKHWLRKWPKLKVVHHEEISSGS